MEVRGAAMRTRQEMINRLTWDAVETAMSSADNGDWIDTIFREGIRGFNDYSNAELAIACRERLADLLDES